MSLPAFENARRYVLERLEHELPPQLVYHSIDHTRDDVLPAAERLAPFMGIEGEPFLLLQTAALFHDIGFIERRAEHEMISVRIASEVLPSFGYFPAQIEAIGGIILATRLPQAPCSVLEELMADADLDVLGREDFMQKNQALRDELSMTGAISTDEAWYRGQLDFMTKHRYFTTAARILRGEGKRRNIELLTALCLQIGEQ